MSANAMERFAAMAARDPIVQQFLLNASRKTSRDKQKKTLDPAAVTRAQSELDTYGKTLEQSAAYLPGVSEALYHGVDPLMDYYNDESTTKILKEFPRRIFDTIQGKPDSSRGERSRALEDAWRMYLGMPQANNSFAISEYAPSQSTGAGDVPYYYKFADPRQMDEFKFDEGGLEPDSIKFLVDSIKRTGSAIGADPALATFKLDAGEDERGPYLSYYDRWDLNPTLGPGTVSVDAFVGKPFEIYDRIYYDPVTYEPRVMPAAAAAPTPAMPASAPAVDLMNSASAASAANTANTANAAITSKPKAKTPKAKIPAAWLGVPSKKQRNPG